MKVTGSHGQFCSSLRGGGGPGDLYLFLNISYSCIEIRLHTGNQLPRLPGSAFFGVGGSPCN